MTHLEKMAKAGHNSMFEESWDDLDPNSIERKMWVDAAKAMILSFDFPQDFIKLHRELFNKFD